MYKDLHIGQKYVFTARLTTKYKCLQSTGVGEEVRGVALLDARLYVVRKHSSEIEVLHPLTLTPLCTVPVPIMTNPGSMASCQTQQSLYVTCFSKKEVLKIAVTGLSVCLKHVCSAICQRGRRFYRAMHFSAKRGIAIACRLSLSVCDVGGL